MKNPNRTFQANTVYLLSVLVIAALAVYLGPPRTAPPDSTVALPEDIGIGQEVPDFEAIPDVDEKKETFFSFLEPYVDAANQRILQQRERLLNLRGKIRQQASLSREERTFLANISKLYEVESDTLTSAEHLDILLRRVDIIPPSLALAQAANESAWGTSRFAQLGNNFFGQWCYTPGCGIVPSQRPPGDTHEVRSFDSIAASVNAYIMNLNTFHVYQNLREIREELREEDMPIDGPTLAEGLDNYSQRGEAYIEELQAMIYSNNLHERDDV